MDRKDEIISLQHEVMQGLLKNNMRSIGLDLWGGEKEKTPVPTSSASEKQPAEKPEDKAHAPGEEKTETLEEIREELAACIGLDSVKQEVESLINWISVCKLRREHQLPTPELSLHMVFSGNPGTGKTMIARLMARIYKCLGVLSKGHLVEVDRSGLVAGYVGQTAGKTREVIEKALGGVLFIDEAYALVNKGENDYGQEAVNTLLKAMEDHRDDLVVIVAGYIELMEDFIHSNPGLESRFNRFIHFPDYSEDEMVAIFRMRCDQGGYTLQADAEDMLRMVLREESKDVKGFGNARGVRNLFENAIARQADRLSKEEDTLTREMLMAITKDDLRNLCGGETA